MFKTLPIALLLLLLAMSCSKPAPQSPAHLQRYHLTGRIVSTDKRANSIMIDGDDIPGYMAAMAMPYPVKDPHLLDILKSGDQITADVLVQGDDSWIENVVVTGHSAPPQPAAPVHVPAAGDAVPNFKFINQDDHSISLRQYRGQALLLTFIYTRCPFPDFCPRVSHQFAEINRQIQADPTLSHKIHLLSITLDPAYDTPKILRAYGLSISGSKSSALFQSWEFAAPRLADLPSLANFFGLDYQKEGASITHSLSTAVIAPDGHIAKWYHDNDWKPSDLIKDAAAALQAVSHV